MEIKRYHQINENVYDNVAIKQIVKDFCDDENYRLEDDQIYISYSINNNIVGGMEKHKSIMMLSRQNSPDMPSTNTFGLLFPTFSKKYVKLTTFGIKIDSFSANVFNQLSVLTQRIENSCDYMFVTNSIKGISFWCFDMGEQEVKCEKIEKVIDIINKDKGGNIYLRPSNTGKSIYLVGYYKIMEEIYEIMTGKEIDFSKLPPPANEQIKINGVDFNLRHGEITVYEYGIVIKAKNENRTDKHLNPLLQMIRKNIPKDNIH